jgi:hypothetical protein
MRLHGEHQDALLLGEDVVVREVWLCRSEPDGPTVGGAHGADTGRIKGHAALDDRTRAPRPWCSPAPEGGYLHLENFRKRVWLPAVETAGVAPLRLHDLRHTCASLAIAAGADVKVLQRMLGHASAALTLDRYGHLLPGQAETSPRGSTRWPELPSRHRWARSRR